MSRLISRWSEKETSPAKKKSLHPLTPFSRAWPCSRQIHRPSFETRKRPAPPAPAPPIDPILDTTPQNRLYNDTNLTNIIPNWSRNSDERKLSNQNRIQKTQKRKDFYQQLSLKYPWKNKKFRMIWRSKGFMKKSDLKDYLKKFKFEMIEKIRKKNFLPKSCLKRASKG